MKNLDIWITLVITFSIVGYVTYKMATMGGFNLNLWGLT